MFICGNDDDAKKTVRGILDQFGWETADMGTAAAARAIEPLCMLWCIPGFERTTGLTPSSCSGRGEGRPRRRRGERRHEKEMKRAEEDRTASSLAPGRAHSAPRTG